jgi:hypothetical protein
MKKGKFGDGNCLKEIYDKPIALSSLFRLVGSNLEEENKDKFSTCLLRRFISKINKNTASFLKSASQTNDKKPR